MTELLTTDETARALRVSQKTVLRLIRSGDLRAEKVGRSWRIRRSDLPCSAGQDNGSTIYLDDNASNPIHPLVVETMVGLWSTPIGNASSSHQVGRSSRSRVESARTAVAHLVDALPNEVVFTSGATEANNLIIRGFTPTGASVAVSEGEHESVLRAAEALSETAGTAVHFVPLTPSGMINLDKLETLVQEHRPYLVSVVAANSETGVLNPIRHVSKIVHRAGAILHCDATQWLGRLPWSMNDLDVDAVSLSAHKMSGPQGVGALVARRAVLRSLRPLAAGGGHENGIRSGTYNVPGIVGFGKAAEIAAVPSEFARIRELRDRFEAQLMSVPGCHIQGANVARLPNTSCVRFEEVPAEALLARLPQIAASIGSACHAGSLEPSRSLLAMGLTRDEAREACRFSLTRFTTSAEVDRATQMIGRAVLEVRQIQKVA